MKARLNRSFIEKKEMIKKVYGAQTARKKNAVNTFLCFFLLCAGLTACGTLPTQTNVPPNLTPTEIKQRAQEYFDKGRYRFAIAYYEILISRYGSDISVKTAAEFEIAHIFVKKKKWVKAEEILTEIIARYERAGGALITPKYYVLAKNDYERINTHLKKRAEKKGSEEKNIDSAESGDAAQPNIESSEPALQFKLNPETPVTESQ